MPTNKATNQKPWVKKAVVLGILYTILLAIGLPLVNWSLGLYALLSVTFLMVLGVVFLLSMAYDHYEYKAKHYFIMQNFISSFAVAAVAPFLLGAGLAFVGATSVSFAILPILVGAVLAAVLFYASYWATKEWLHK